jgi:hypothetical protein
MRGKPLGIGEMEKPGALATDIYGLISKGRGEFENLHALTICGYAPSPFQVGIF